MDEPRAPYLLDLIEISGEPRFYRNSLRSALEGPLDDLDLGQIFEIAAHFATRGDGEVKQSMYAAFERLGYPAAGQECAEALVRVDGLPALLLVARTFGDADSRDRPWAFGQMLKTLEQHHGKQTLPAQLNVFASEWRDEEKTLEEARRQPIPRPDYQPAELERAADELLVEQDRERLVRTLRMFLRHPFPGPIDRLLELARGEDHRISRGARGALENLTDPRIRSLALDSLNHPQARQREAALLARNSAPGDYRILEAALARPAELDDYHNLSFDVVTKFVPANRSEEAEPSLLHIYENAPCTVCRHRAVDELIALDRFPDWMRAECLHDADSDIREAAAQPLSGSEPPFTLPRDFHFTSQAAPPRKSSKARTLASTR